MHPAIRAVLLAWALLLPGSRVGAFARAAPPGLSVRIGIAVRHGATLCFSVPDAGLAGATRVALIAPTQPQAIARAVIVGRGPGCAGWRNPAAAGYRLRLTGGRAANGLVLFGIVGAARVVDRDGQVSARLAPAGRWLRFRSCASVDGVHLTIWRGVPLAGARLWHAYYYLNQDLVADCTEQDTADPPPDAG